VSNHAAIFRKVLETDPQWLNQIRRGVEKESLRVSEDQAELAQTPHPSGLGSALTHPSITTDYSEALLEFITPVSASIAETERALQNLHLYTVRQLDGELLWNASMPCIVHGDAGIPIAQFGTSNVGQMKRIYRNGLSVRYGRKMQAIAGIHYNFSLHESFWAEANKLAGNLKSTQAFQTDGYLALIRNFFSRVWLLMYLIGASPAVCASFVEGNPSHPLQPLGDQQDTYYLPFSTSLRMGDLGYTSQAQSGIEVCYNDLDEYISALRSAILTTHQAYSAYSLMGNGERAQLNDSLLQIENEYYSPIRPKRVTRSGEAPVVALTRGGIEYVEVRCIDINPFIPLGIDSDTMRLLDLFILSCMIDESPQCDVLGQQRNNTNLQRVVNRGREPGLTLLSAGGGEVTLCELAQPTLNSMAEIAGWFDYATGGDGNYLKTVAEAKQRVSEPSLTPSARILSEMQKDGLTYRQLAWKYSREWHAKHLNQTLDPATLASLQEQAISSLAKQRELEASQQQPFEDYVANFYSQYQ
tara:strand:- start:3 stop:1586 length:1584 start_codon:yes stop_codon:yes gene_type:complete